MASVFSEMGGLLFYLMGASGSGKDSLLDSCRQYLAESASCLIAHRYITRPAQAGGENHVAIEKPDFRLRRQSGLFAMAWEAHDTLYGIGIEADLWLEQGFHVLVNGSRAYYPEARQRYQGTLRPILVSVSPQTLRQRLTQRGRENSDAIEARLSRLQVAERPWQPDDVFELDNNGTLANTKAQLIRYIQAQE